jgi:uncharacterized protein YdaU (DUF1376 family)
MTLEEEGAYIRLLAHCWDTDDCTLPDDDNALAELSRLGTKWHTNDSGSKLKQCFEPHPKKPGRLINVRLHSEFTSLKKFTKKKQEAGRQGGVKSGESRRNRSETPVNGQAKHTFDFASSKREAKRTSSSSSSSSSSREKPSLSPLKEEPVDNSGTEEVGYPTMDEFDAMIRQIAEKRTMPGATVGSGSSGPPPTG